MTRFWPNSRGGYPPGPELQGHNAQGHGPSAADPRADPDGAGGHGVHLRVTDRDVLPAVVAALVTEQLAVYAVTPRPATLEDIYFALTGRGWEGS